MGQSIFPFLRKQKWQRVNRRVLFLVAWAVLTISFLSPLFSKALLAPHTFSLPPVRHKGEVSIEEAIFRRKSVRNYTSASLTLNDISQLLWAASGITVDGISGPTRAYPSAGGIYPLEVYLIAGKVKNLPQGIYIYQWEKHQLRLLKKGDFRSRVTAAAYGQKWIASAPASLIFTATYSKTVQRYRMRAHRYIPMDIGGAAQNVSLQAEALGLNTVIIGAFQDQKIQHLLDTKTQTPLCMMPIGKK